ncbi:Exocyst complex component S5 [Saitoella coloradoensis]
MNHDPGSENAAILRKYNLDSLEPHHWKDSSRPKPASSNSAYGTRRASRYEVLQQEEDPATETDELLQDDSDPLGMVDSVSNALRRKGVQIDTDPKVRAQFMITSKTFQPRTFLRDVHANASYSELRTGQDWLQHSIEQRRDDVKELVGQNFDRFVTAKSTIDDVYQDMKSATLNRENDYGIGALKSATLDANAKAQQIFTPIMENREKANTLRSTLSVLDRYKSYFNLPSTLLDCQRRKDHEGLIREYRKGETLFKEYKASDPNQQGTALMVNQRRIFEKVWNEAQRIVDNWKKDLWDGLSGEGRTDEQQMKAIGYLLEIGIDENPIWQYLQVRHNHLRNMITATFEQDRIQFETLRRKLAAKPAPSVKQLVSYLRVPFHPKQDFAFHCDSEAIIEMWEALGDFVDDMMNELGAHLVIEFWRTVQSFVDGKAQKSMPMGPNGISKKHLSLDQMQVAQLRGMVEALVLLICRLIGEFISSPPVALPVDDMEPSTPVGDVPPVPALPAVNGGKVLAFVPAHANAVSASKYLSSTLREIAQAVDEIHSLGLSSTVTDALRTVLGTAMQHFNDAVCKAWQQDTKYLVRLENWTRATENHDNTGFPRAIQSYTRAIIANAEKILNVANTTSGSAVQKVLQVMPTAKMIGAVRSTFLSGLYTVQQDICSLALSLNATPTATTKKRISAVTAEEIREVDASDTDTRILLTVSNMAEMKESVIPKLINQFELAFSLGMTEDLRTLINVLEQADDKLFKRYINGKARVVSEIVRGGVLNSGIPWATLSRPVEVHSYVYDALVTLVLVHSQVWTLTPSLLGRIITALTNSLAQDLLDAIRGIDRFGVGGMLQATLEVEFFHQTLSQFVDSTAGEKLSMVYRAIEDGYTSSDVSAEDLQAELGHVKHLLQHARKATATQFACFRKSKGDRAKSKGDAERRDERPGEASRHRQQGSLNNLGPVEAA